jgi:hypothetical protein
MSNEFGPQKKPFFFCTDIQTNRNTKCIKAAKKVMMAQMRCIKPAVGYPPNNSYSHLAQS